MTTVRARNAMNAWYIYMRCFESDESVKDKFKVNLIGML